jgi:hypothetical protein
MFSEGGIMNLYEKIIALYPTLTQNDFMPTGTIKLQNDLDGKGDYIAKWEHPTLARPTEEQLA